MKYEEFPYIFDEKSLLSELSRMIFLVAESQYDFYKQVDNKIFLIDEFYDMIIKALEWDLSCDSYIANIIKLAHDELNYSQSEIITKAIKDKDYSEESYSVVSDWQSLSKLLEVCDDKIVLPEKWISPKAYEKLKTFMMIFDFEMCKEKKRKAFRQCGDFSPKKIIDMMGKMGCIDISSEFHYFPTPENIVSDAQNHLKLSPTDTLLEPSAGTGNLLAGLTNENITCVELAEINYLILLEKGFDAHNMRFEDFECDEKFNKIIMNPPFMSRMDAKHIVRAWDMLADDGILVAIHSVAIESATDKASINFQKLLQYRNYHQLYDGEEFAKSGKGTKIKTMLSVFHKIS